MQRVAGGWAHQAHVHVQPRVGRSGVRQDVRPRTGMEEDLGEQRREQ